MYVCMYVSRKYEVKMARLDLSVVERAALIGVDEAEELPDLREAPFLILIQNYSRLFSKIPSFHQSRVYVSRIYFSESWCRCLSGCNC